MNYEHRFYNLIIESNNFESQNEYQKQVVKTTWNWVLKKKLPLVHSYVHLHVNGVNKITALYK